LPGLKHYEERMIFASPEKRVSLTFPSPYLRHFPTPLVVERTDGADHLAEHRTVPYEEAFRAELHAFRQCVLDGLKPETSIEDAPGAARWSQAIARCLAASRAARGGELSRRSKIRRAKRSSRSRR